MKREVGQVEIRKSLILRGKWRKRSLWKEVEKNSWCGCSLKKLICQPRRGERKREREREGVVYWSLAFETEVDPVSTLSRTYKNRKLYHEERWWWPVRMGKHWPTAFKKWLDLGTKRAVSSREREGTWVRMSREQPGLQGKGAQQRVGKWQKPPIYYSNKDILDHRRVLFRQLKIIRHETKSLSWEDCLGKEMATSPVFLSGKFRG